MPIKIFPSLISGDLLHLHRQIKQLENYCDGFHLDVMDYSFVPNLTFGPPFINAIAAICKKPLLVHCMLEYPFLCIKDLQLRGDDTICFHVESKFDFDEIKKHSFENNLKVSVAIKPKTPLSELISFLPLIDQVLLMSVEPGFSGQAFLEISIDRLHWLSDYKKNNSLSYVIGMDGGINATNIHGLTKLGAEVFSVASALFDTKNPELALKNLYEKASKK